MYKCREASTKEIIAFQKEFCENLSAAIGMNNKHRVQVESYEELPPWSFVYNADGSDRFLKDDIIMLKVCDLEKRVVYYPVFPEKRGLKLLQCWDMAVPPKLTAFEQEGKQVPTKACVILSPLPVCLCCRKAVGINLWPTASIILFRNYISCRRQTLLRKRLSL